MSRMELKRARKEETSNEGVANFVQKKRSQRENTVERCQVDQRGEGGTYTDTMRLPVPTPFLSAREPYSDQVNQNSDFIYCFLVSSWKALHIPLTDSFVLSTLGLLILTIFAPLESSNNFNFCAIEEGCKDLTQISLLLPLTTHAHLEISSILSRKFRQRE